MSSETLQSTLGRFFLIALPALVFALLNAALAHAAPPSRGVSIGRVPVRKKIPHEKPYSLFTVLNVGPSSIAEPGLDISGTQFEAMLLGELRAGGWSFTAGGGYFRSALTGRSTRSTPSSGLGLSSYELTTEATALQAGIAHRIADRIEAGVLAQALLGPDVGFNSGFGNSGVHAAWLAGLQSNYELRPGGDTRLKLGARYVRSLNLEHRLDAIQATLSFGLPVL